MLEQDNVLLYDGNEALRTECRQFTIGSKSDEWYHVDSDEVIKLSSGSTCHRDDEYDVNETNCGYTFHTDEQDDEEIIWVESADCYAFQNDCTYGVVDIYGNEGYFIDTHEDYVFDDYNDMYYISERVANYNDVYYYYYLIVLLLVGITTTSSSSSWRRLCR